ncbi:conjugal transfer protein TraB [Halovenus sp. WSH3]|uniref:Conjugal transfer protein TraB n=1 Tax=Halovenus carboxidivorans TaxID=2692199 RepID=A0A6B0TEH8_9EURY|nr:TraB/GumN family protein [Halovenus carboxidivorans]MXR51609.1 conjugal transfer protein TraB [Halovenus carboxidivorans]
MSDDGEVLDPDTAGGAAAEGSVTVVGTAHVSEDSVREVEETIEREQPDVVAVELDRTRYERLKGEEPDDIDGRDLISGRTMYQFLAYWLLSYVQARLGDEFDVEPGADMMAAVEAAEARGSAVALVDRDIQVTVQRLWSGMRFREKLAIVAALLVETLGPWTAGWSIGFFFGLLGGIAASALGGPYLVPAALGDGIGLPVLGSVVGSLGGILDTLLVVAGISLAIGLPIGALLARSAGDIEAEEFDMARLTDDDVVTAMIKEFRRFSPGGAQALIDERDAYIAHRLLSLREQGYHVVAVVGAGHRAGIENYLANPDTLPDPESLVGEPSTSRWRSALYKAVGYAFTLGFLFFFVLLAMAGVQGDLLLNIFIAWFLVNGIIAAGLAKLAGAHWTSAGAGGAVAWLTSVNPLLAPGWFAGYVELRYTSINPADIGRLNDLLADPSLSLWELLGEMRDVPTFRLILVVAMTNIGSFVASVLFATVLLPQFAADVGGITGLGQQMLEGARNSAELIWELVT